MAHSKGEKYDKLKETSLTGDIIDDVKNYYCGLDGFYVFLDRDNKEH